MSLFIDKQYAMEIDLVISVMTADGAGEYDGVYTINYVLVYRKHIIERSVFYRVKEERDASFARLLSMLEENESAHNDDTYIELLPEGDDDEVAP